MINLSKKEIKGYLQKSRCGKNILRLIRISLKPVYSLWNKFRRLLGKVDMLYLDVTHLCNLRCVGCYTGAGLKKHDELTLEEKKSVIRQARKMGARFVSLSGSGEPLLCKDIFTLIDYIRQQDMGVTIFTNGTFLSEEMAKFLLSKKVEIFFKLYSLNADIFDRMVGIKNAYEWVDYSYRYNGALKRLRIPSGLKYLLDLRPIQESKNLVKIETLITKINYSTLPEVARFCKQMCLSLYLETPVFQGRAIENYDDIILNSDEYRNLYCKLTEILGKEYFKRHRKQPCFVERNPVVWTNGEVGFCSSRGADIGNVRNAPLNQLFSKAKQLKHREDRLIAKRRTINKYFYTCKSRQYYEAKYGIPCNY